MKVIPMNNILKTQSIDITFVKYYVTQKKIFKVKVDEKRLQKSKVDNKYGTEGVFTIVVSYHHLQNIG